MSTVHIVGGGIIGLCSAFYLRKSGIDVIIYDAGEIHSGCSFGNAGLITPSHFIPLASPGVISKGIRWMFRSTSPFYIRPRINLDLMQWLWRFYANSTARHVSNTASFMVDFQLLSKELYSSLVSNEKLEFDFKEDGVLMMARTEKGFHEMTEMSKYANDLGIFAQKRSPDDILTLEPLAKPDLAGGLFFPQDAHMSPSKLMESLYQKLIEMGVTFKLKYSIKGFATQKEFITHLIRVDGRAIPVTKVLLCAGSWTGKLVKKLGLKMLIQDGKGYSFTTTEVKNCPKIPGILEEAAVAVTPMVNHLRIGGSLELSGMNPSISRTRAHAVISSIKDYYNHIEVSIPEDEHIWFGYRPCSADGLPYVGKYPQYQNLFVATGHAMQGMSLGPATGLLVAEMMTMRKTSLPVSFLQPDRFM